jgi:hypothetical protein
MSPQRGLSRPIVQTEATTPNNENVILAMRSTKINNPAHKCTEIPGDWMAGQKRITGLRKTSCFQWTKVIIDCTREIKLCSVTGQIKLSIFLGRSN